MSLEIGKYAEGRKRMIELTQSSTGPVTVPPPIDPRSGTQYQGLHWRPVRLPRSEEQWLMPKSGLCVGTHRDPEEPTLEEVQRYAKGKPWVWPDERVCFISDVHADADAFLRCLVATGGVRLTGPGDHDFELTDEGRKSVFVLGGDCFDKGPSNLRLLRTLSHFRQLGPNLKILAGNHDLRLLLGIAYAERREPTLDHLFVRLGKKTMKLFAEVYDEYVRHDPDAEFLSDEEFKARYYPQESWYEDFPLAIRGTIPEPKIAKEVLRIRQKSGEIEAMATQLGMRLGMLHAVLKKCEELFLSPGGEFHWFFEEMTLAYRRGSFLFVHAGVDEVAAACLAESGVAGLNHWFAELKEHDLFALYHGSVGNVFRTKYRDIDFAMGDSGRAALARAGIYAIVHGHRNLLRGARISLRAGILNFECDASVDTNTRALEGLEGPGAAALVFEPEGKACAMSSDYPFIRVFDSAKLLPFSTQLGQLQSTSESLRSIDP